MSDYWKNYWRKKYSSENGKKGKGMLKKIMNKPYSGMIPTLPFGYPPPAHLAYPFYSPMLPPYVSPVPF